ncbi:FIVAR domain-containing protein [Enterococcus mundtii]|uniref:FIVAR domain-containing protein n=1 Tax=Enterococcus mundtii TaxID=53346 RepID=UPI001CF1A8E7|nr:FIVAR domain-containing protein [Enterococcus mundtii]MCA6775336.1 FIVAR domain-containing protein [Enterococcus mundtii]
MKKSFTWQRLPKWQKWGLSFLCIGALSGFIYPVFSQNENLERTQPNEEKRPALDRIESANEKDSLLDRLKNEDQEPSVFDRVFGENQANSTFQQVFGRGEQEPIDRSMIQQVLAQVNERENAQNLVHQTEDQEPSLVSVNRPVVPSLPEEKPIILDPKEPENEDTEELPSLPTPPTPPLVPEEPVLPLPPIIGPEEPINPPIVPPIIPPVVETNYSVLEDLFVQAQAIDVSNYLSSSVSTFVYERRVSERMLADQNSTQAQVDTQVSRLRQAMDQLVRKGDSSALKETIKQAESIDRERYTEATVATLDSVLEEAKQLVSTDEHTQETVDRMNRRLSRAINQLEEKPSMDLALLELERLITHAGTLNREDYTSASYDQFNHVLTDVKALIGEADLSEEEVIEGRKRLEEAIAQLELVGNTDQLVALLSKAHSLDSTQYTVESWAIFVHARQEAEQVSQSNEPTQTVIDQATEALRSAMSNLVSIDLEDQLPEIKRIAPIVIEVAEDHRIKETNLSTINSSPLLDVLLNEAEEINGSQHVEGDTQEIPETQETQKIEETQETQEKTMDSSVSMDAETSQELGENDGQEPLNAFELIDE